MRNVLRAALLLCALLFASRANAAACFWVGGTGNINDPVHWASSSGGTTLTCNAASIPGVADPATLDASSGGGTVSCNAAVTFGSLTMGAFTGTVCNSTDTAGLTLGTFSCTGTGTRTVNLGAQTWTINGTSGTVWDCGTSTNLTLNANTSTVNLAATASGIRNFNNGGKTYNSVSITNPSWNVFTVRFDAGGQVISLVNLTLTNLGAVQFSTGTNVITGTLATNSSQTNQTLIGTGGTGATLQLSAPQTLNWVYLRQITATTSALSATNSFDGGGNVLNGGQITAPQPGSGRCIGC